MLININGQQHEKDWLLSNPAGQTLLLNAKGSGVRPKCMCVQPGVEMYIATRGNLHYMARMPNSADKHDAGCFSHLVPCKLYSLDTPARIFGALLNGRPYDGSGKWNEFRADVLQKAIDIDVDGDKLADRLLVPFFFNKNRANEQRASYDEFFANGAGEDATKRRWLLACVKEASPSMYGARLTMKHMPGIVFWSVKEHAEGLIEAAASDSAPLCLLEVRKTPSGVLITDCAIHSNDDASTTTISTSNVPVTSSPSEVDKLDVARSFLGLSPSAPIGDVFTALLDDCFARANTK